MGTKTHSYKSIFHPPLDEDQTKPVCFIKRINLIKKDWRNFRFKIFAVTSSIVTAKILNLQFLKKNCDQTDFHNKADWFSLILLYMGVEDELLWTSFIAQNPKSKLRDRIIELNYKTLNLGWFEVYTAWVKISPRLEVFWSYQNKVIYILKTNKDFFLKRV